jgi:serine/threonine-protein kinase HipA
LFLNISETDNSLDFELAISVAKYFRVSDPHAKDIISHTVKIVSNWDKVASGIGIPQAMREQMAPAFEH